MADGRRKSSRLRRRKSGVEALTWEASSALAVGLYVVVQYVLPAAAIANPVVATAAQTLRPIGTMAALCFVCVAVFLYIKKNREDGPLKVAAEPVLAPTAAPSVTNPNAVAQAWGYITQTNPPQAEKPTAWSIELLRQIEWKRVEELTAAYFREKTFRTETIAAGPDGGIDVKLFVQGKAEPFAVVQCKAWNSRRVDVKPVRELLGVMAAEKVQKGIFVTTGTYTEAAATFARNNPLNLVTGEMLMKGILALPEEAQRRLLAVATEGDYMTPTCPSCGIKMAMKNGKQGEFWGCPNFPKCRSSFPMKRNPS